MDTIHIREMNITDIPTLITWGEGEREIWGSDEDKWYDKKGLTKWLNAKGDDILLVAENHGKLAGMCMLRYMFDEYYCDTLYVHAEHQRLGIGKKLLEEAENRMRVKGITLYFLETRQDNARGVAFYKKFGFKEMHRNIRFEKRI